MRPDDKRRFNGRLPKWDVETERQMYDAGVSVAAIAKALGATYQAVYILCTVLVSGGSGLLQ